MESSSAYADAMFAEATALMSHINAVRRGDKEAERAALAALECAQRDRVAALNQRNRALS